MNSSEGLNKLKQCILDGYLQSLSVPSKNTIEPYEAYPLKLQEKNKQKVF